MRLGLGGAGAMADQRCSPADTGARWVERLGGQRQPHFGEFHQQTPGGAQPFLDVEGIVEVRVVDQSLPADGGTRLLEIHAHHDVQAVADLVGQLAQTPRVVARGFHVVDRARADDHDQARVVAIENALQGPTTLEYRALGFLGKRDFPLESFGGDQHVLREDVDIVDLLF